MNAVTDFSLCLPAGEPAGPLCAKPGAAALLSILLHVMLAAVTIAFASGSGSGTGPSGDGTDAGTGNPVRITGILSLQGDAGDSKSAPPLAALQAEDQASDAADAGQPAVEEAQAANTTAPLPEPEAVPVPVRNMAKKKNTPPKGERTRPPGKIRSEPVRDRQRKAPGARSAPITGKAWNGQTAEAVGTGNGGASGGGSGTHAGTGGSAQSADNRGIGLYGKVDSMPRVLRRSGVRYPEHARKHKITGHVLLRFLLDEKGGISQLQVVKAEPPGVFDQAALAAVRQWRFAPAMKDGSPVPYWVNLPMPFVLK